MDNTTFKKVPTSNTMIASSDKPIANSVTNLYFGAKADTSITSGNYSNTVHLSAVTNYVAPKKKTIYDIANMQDMTSTSCFDTTTPLSTATSFTTTKSDDTSLIPQTTLIDTRDNKSYIIRKLADGNCWMTQNLALEGGTTITPTDSNVTSNYTLPVSSTTGFNNNTVAYVDNGTHIDNTDDIASTNTGGFYSYIAATAGTGSDVTTHFTNATGSICPKGWKLPSAITNAKYNSTNTGEMWQLYQAYDTLTSSYTTSMNVNFKNAWSPGHVGVYQESKFVHKGTYSIWWSSTGALASANAYWMRIESGRVLNPGTGYNYRYNGFSVRCVAE